MTLGRYLAFVLLVVLAPARAACVVESPPHTVALVELYASERCSSCPAAERWLSRLGSRIGADRVLPFALRVDTWEYLGKKDPYAERRLTERQRRLSMLQRMALVDTPHVVLQGREFRPWQSREFDDAVKRINARPARALLRVETRPSAPGWSAVAARVEIEDPAQRADAALYMATFLRRRQDTLVLEWQGPFAVPGDGRLQLERSLALLPGATREASGVAAFVQNRRTAEVLQAVRLPACSP